MKIKIKESLGKSIGIKKDKNGFYFCSDSVKEAQECIDKELIDLSNRINIQKTEINLLTASFLRDCWSSACASGHKNFPSLSLMQHDFNRFLIEKNICINGDRNNS